MVSEINWSYRAEISFEEALTYVAEKFSEKDARRFYDLTMQKLHRMQSNPRLGRKVGKQINFRKTIINKRITLYFQYKPRKKEIELLLFWNTLQNPKRLRF